MTSPRRATANTVNPVHHRPLPDRPRGLTRCPRSRAHVLACRGAVPAQYSATVCMCRLSASSLNRALKGVEINHRRGVKREKLREQQPADNRDAQRPAQFRAGALFERQRQRAEQRRHRRHHDRAGNAAGTPGRWISPAAVLRSRSASSAKSIIMIAFFFTMPMSRMMPISAISERSSPADDQRQQRAHARRGQAGQNRDRMNVALVKHAQHDVDHHDRREDQERLARQRRAEFRRAAGEGGRHRFGRPISCSRLLNGVTASPERAARAQVERERHGRELALMHDGQSGAVPVSIVAKALSGTICPVVDLT